MRRGRPKKSIFDALATPLVIARTPLLPLDAVLDVLRSDDVFASLLQTLRADPVIRQAIRIASPTLSVAVNEWCATGVPANDRVPLRALAYFVRMSSRPTPFGICAGIGEVETGEDTTLAIDSDGRRTKTRLDMGLLTDLCRDIEKGEHRGRVRYVVNNAITKRGGRLYVTNVLLVNSDGLVTEQRPVTLSDTASVQFVRNFAREARTYDEIVDNLALRFESTIEDARRHLDILIEAGVIISELRPSPVGDPIARLMHRVAEIDTSLAEPLRQITARLAAFDRCPLGQRNDHLFEQVMEGCRSLSPSESPVQVDMYTPMSGTLGENVMRDAATLCEIYARMGAQQSLERYRERFLRRYEGNERMVPLLELTDENLGLGRPEEPETSNARNVERDLLVMRLACDALRSGASEIQLTEEQLAVIAPPLAADVPLAGADVGFHLASRSRDALNRGEYLLFSDGYVASTNGAAKNIGRFLHLFDERTLYRARTLASRGADGVLRAELVYPPAKGRSYNIFVRPALINSEITIGVFDSSDRDVVRLDDLWVGLERGKFFLWSASRSCRVVPIESHHFSTARLAPNICRLLSLIAGEGVRAIRTFPWAEAQGLVSLPRVRTGRIVLSLRTWRFEAKEFGSSAREADGALRRLRTEWAMPRYVTLVEPDSRLLIDLDSACAGALLNDQRNPNARELLLQEFLEPPNGWLGDSTGASYVAEFIASVTPTYVPPTDERSTRAVHLVNERRRYGLGSGWLFAKIYLGSQSMEPFLLKSILPLVEQFRSSGALKKWFFVRYSDPNSHLRVRIRFSDDRYDTRASVFVRAMETYLEDGTIERYVLDTYDPEYERYGGQESIEATERFFSADSDLCASLLRRAEQGRDARVEMAAQSFVACINARSDLRELALDAFVEAGRGKMPSQDRRAIKRTGAIDVNPALSELLAAALKGEDRQQRMRSLFHLHCNRLGVTPEVEKRAIMMLRSLVLQNHLGFTGNCSD